MCGCVDRMPVVTSAACTEATADASTVDVSFSAATGAFAGKFNMGAIEYGDCGDLAAHYKNLVGADSHLAAYMDSRVVGEGGCDGAINDFLGGKGLVLKLAYDVPDPSVPVACLAAEDCRRRALALGLQEGGGGHSFAGSYRTKGCYFYANGTYGGMAFFGTGGTVAEMSVPVDESSKKRLWCSGGDFDFSTLN